MIEDRNRVSPTHEKRIHLGLSPHLSASELYASNSRYGLSLAGFILRFLLSGVRFGRGRGSMIVCSYVRANSALHDLSAKRDFREFPLMDY